MKSGPEIQASLRAGRQVGRLLRNRARRSPDLPERTLRLLRLRPDGRSEGRVAEATRLLLGRRSGTFLAEQIGLTTLYNRVDDGAYTDIAALHRQLDEAVVACYGWPKSVARVDRELVRRLTELNREIAEGGRPYNPFGYLGA